MSIKPLIVFGATGKQGCAVVRSLLSHPLWSATTHPIYAIVRDPSSQSASALQSLSPAITLVKGDFTNVPAAFDALPSAPWATYVVSLPHQPDEVARSKACIDVTIARGGTHVVFSSVDRGPGNGGYVPSKCEHFQSKHEIEEYLFERAEKHEGFSYTVIRPTFFMDNMDWGFVGRVFAAIWRDYIQRPLVMTDTRDIGMWAAAAMVEPEAESYRNQGVNIAGDKLTYEEANRIFKEKTGKNIPTAFGLWGMLLYNLSGNIKEMVNQWKGVGSEADPIKTNKVHNMNTWAGWVEQSRYVSKSK